MNQEDSFPISWSKRTVLFWQFSSFSDSHYSDHFVLIFLLQVLHFILNPTGSLVEIVLYQLIPNEISLINFNETNSELFLVFLVLEVNNHKIMGREDYFQICAFNVAVVPCYICDFAQFSIFLLPSLVKIFSDFNWFDRQDQKCCY